MDIKEIKKMEIVGVKEDEFSCHLCNTSATMKYEVKINDAPEDEDRVPICLICHNKIAEQLFSQTKQRRYKY